MPEIGRGEPHLELDVFTLVDEAKNGKSDRCVPIWMAPAGFGVDTGSKNLSDPASMRVCGYTRPQSTNISNGANKRSKQGRRKIRGADLDLKIPQIN